MSKKIETRSLFFILQGCPLLTPDQKQEIITRIKEKGERVTDLAKDIVQSGRLHTFKKAINEFKAFKLD